MKANAKSKKIEQIYSQNKSSSDNKSPKKDSKENIQDTIQERSLFLKMTNIKIIQT